MTCANCARHVTEAIQSVPGVQSASVNLEARQAFVRWSSGSERNIPAIIQAVESAGYGAKIIADEGPARSWPMQALRLAVKPVDRHARHFAADDWGMDF